MRHQIAAALVVLASALVEGQTRGATFRTPWGDPDLQGVWSNQTLTPLERPAEFAGKTHLTEAEAAEYQARLRKENDADVRTPGTARDIAVAYNDFWWDRGNSIVPDRRTSLIVDPPDGRIPALTPAAQAGLATNRALNPYRNSQFPAGPEDLDVYTRCIIRGPLPRLSTGYNNNYQIVQTPGYVAILQEQMHETRIIPLGKVPHLDSSVRQWLGDSRGSWDGDTLVVETTNFSDVPGATFRGATKNMMLVERFRRVDADTLDYRFTVSDPETWVRPWTVAVPWHRPDGMLYEYACHEGNYGLENTLRAARTLEKEKAHGK